MLTTCLTKSAIILFAFLMLVYFLLFEQINETFASFYIKRKKWNVESINSHLRKELDVLPWDFVEQRKSEQLRLNASCANFPNLLQLEFHNKYWQIYQNAEVQMRIYGAYFDKRPTLPHRPAIRLLAFINQVHEVRVQNYCQIWFNEHTQPTTVHVASYKMLWNIPWVIPRGHLAPYLVTCILPEPQATLIPQAVSVATEHCQNASNIFRVVYNALPPTREEPAKFAICVKALRLPHKDLSTMLTEWLELMRMFGVDQVYMDTLQVHPNISKVIDYYVAQDFVQSRSTSLAQLAAGLPLSQQFASEQFLFNRRYHEMVQYNDCFYRSIYKYEFIAVVDIDEIIMPLAPYRNWLELLKAARSNQLGYNCTGNIDAFCFRHAHFALRLSADFGSSPLLFLRHLRRHKDFSVLQFYCKCWHNASSVLAVHNHLPYYYVSDKTCKTFLNTSVAQLQHYRHAVKDNQNLGELIEDANILRFSEALTNRSFKVFNELGFAPDE